MFSLIGRLRPSRPRTDSVDGAGRRLMRLSATVVVASRRATPAPLLMNPVTNGFVGLMTRGLSSRDMKAVEPLLAFEASRPSISVPNMGGAVREFS